MLLLTGAACGQPRLHSPIREAAVCCLQQGTMGESEGDEAEEEPDGGRGAGAVAAGGGGAGGGADVRRSTMRGGRGSYAANEGAQAVLSEPLTNETLRIWVKRWYWATATACRTYRRGIRASRERALQAANPRDQKTICQSRKILTETSARGIHRRCNDDARYVPGAKSFNRPIGNWNVEKVTDMAAMFLFASKFNQPIGGWKVHNVTDMSLMFNWASAFNQPIGGWNVEKARVCA